MVKKQTLFLVAGILMLVSIFSTGCQKNDDKPFDKSLAGTVWSCEQVEVDNVYHKLNLKLMDGTFKFTFLEKSGFEKTENEYTGSYRYVHPNLTLDMLQSNGKHIKHHLVVNGNTCSMKFEGYQFTLLKNM